MRYLPNHQVCLRHIINNKTELNSNSTNSKLEFNQARDEV